MEWWERTLLVEIQSIPDSRRVLKTRPGQYNTANHINSENDISIEHPEIFGEAWYTVLHLDSEMRIRLQAYSSRVSRDPLFTGPKLDNINRVGLSTLLLFPKYQRNQIKQ